VEQLIVVEQEVVELQCLVNQVVQEVQELLLSEHQEQQDLLFLYHQELIQKQHYRLRLEDVLLQHLQCLEI
jgi:hypothetical protein